MNTIIRFDKVPDAILTGLADRDVSLWLECGDVDNVSDALASLIRLPWRHVFLDCAGGDLVAELERPDSGAFVARRGFVHVIDGDPSRVELPPRSLPVFLLAGRGGGSAFENQLRRMTMLEELRRSGIRQLVVVGAKLPKSLAELWSAGFRTNLVVVDPAGDAPDRLSAWLADNGDAPTASLVSQSTSAFAEAAVGAFASAYEDESLLIRVRDELDNIRKFALAEIDDPERPLLVNYELIMDREFAPIAEGSLPEEAFNNFFRGETRDWRPFAAGLPWIRNDEPWRKLQSLLRRLDAVGPPENRIAYIMSEPGAGGTTLARHLAFTAARAGYPTLVAQQLPFTPEALPLINFLTRAHQRIEDSRHSAEAGFISDGERYEAPWLLVFDRVHWEFRDTELRRFAQQLEHAGRPVCILVVTGPQREPSYYDETKFKALAEIHHMLDQTETLELGRHINRFLRSYGKERPDWQWANFQQAHSVRYLEGMAAFWITLSFWLQTQYDLSDSIQDWVYRAFRKAADTPEIRRAILHIAALSSERLPMPEQLIEQGASDWPVPLLLDDRRPALAPLGMVRLSNDGAKYWAIAHDILGRLLLNAVFYDGHARSELGLDAARDPLHLRFLLLEEISSKPMLGERDQRGFGEDFATTVFKIDPSQGRVTWLHLWRDVLAALDGMPAALRNGSRVFRHHSAISRRRIAWLDQSAYGVTPSDQVALLERAAADISYALTSIDATQGSDPDVNLYNSLANAYFDLARVRAEQGADAVELAHLREMASDATRRAFEQSPSSPYVIETHVKSLLATAEESPHDAPALCIEALEIIYSAIRHDRSEMRRHALADLADRALTILMRSDIKTVATQKPESPTELLVAAWLQLAEAANGRAPSDLKNVSKEALASVRQLLEDSVGAGNPQVAKLHYQVLAAVAPLDFAAQLRALEDLVAADYRLTPQLRLEYALLLLQGMRATEADKQFRSLRKLWRETDIFAQVPDQLRWLVDPTSGHPRVVTAVSAYDHGHRAMARVREFGRFDVPYRPQEFGVREHAPGTVFNANVTLGHNGPFLRPVGSLRR